MGRGILLWLLGVPIPIIILLALILTLTDKKPRRKAWFFLQPNYHLKLGDIQCR